eukprot:gene17931-19720_t
MSIAKEVARLSLRPCLRGMNEASRRMVKYQNNFEGVFNAFLWDESTGFGVTTKGDKTVIVSSNHKHDLLSKSESDVWKDIINPTTLISHEALRDELQMQVLAYDDDAVKLEITSADLSDYSLLQHFFDGDMHPCAPFLRTMLALSPKER